MKVKCEWLHDQWDIMMSPVKFEVTTFKWCLVDRAVQAPLKPDTAVEFSWFSSVQFSSFHAVLNWFDDISVQKSWGVSKKGVQKLKS